MNPDIRFPNLGIDLNHVSKGFSLFGLDIAWYGVTIAFGMLAGILIASARAKETKQDPDFYLNFALIAILMSVIGARLYYVIFSFDEFKDDLLRIFNLRTGGLAIYGGVIAAVLTAYIYGRIKKVKFTQILDTCVMGLIAGQAIGRWGNFFNREAFGGYTEGIFAMQIKASDMNQGNLNSDAITQIVTYNGESYYQVHPTFLYESVWNFLVLIILFLFRNKTKFKGELFLIYLSAYGIGRFVIEGLRTDQLRIGDIAVSQALGLLLFMFGVVVIVYKRLKLRKYEQANKMG